MSLSSPPPIAFELRKKSPAIGIARPVWIWLITSNAALLVGGYYLRGRYGMLAGFFAAFAISCLVLSYGALRLRSIFPSREIEGQDPWGARAALQSLANRLGFPMPNLRLFESETPAAFAGGVGAWDSCLFLSRGLLDGFPRDEIEAVLAYEAASLARHDAARMTVASALASLFSAAGWLLDRPFAFGGRPPRPGSAIVAPVVSAIQRLFDGPGRTFRRDEDAAALVDDRRALARAIFKMDRYAATRPIAPPVCDGTLFFVNPLTQGQRTRTLATRPQPHAEERIKRLVGHFPL